MDEYENYEEYGVPLVVKFWTSVIVALVAVLGGVLLVLNLVDWIRG